MLYCMAIMRFAQWSLYLFFMFFLLLTNNFFFNFSILKYNCFAFSRLVNGVVEKTRKKEVASIAVAADAIGIPRMLIDIRHGEQVSF